MRAQGGPEEHPVPARIARIIQNVGVRRTASRAPTSSSAFVPWKLARQADWGKQPPGCRRCMRARSRPRRAAVSTSAQATLTLAEPFAYAPRYDDVSDVDTAGYESSSSQEDAMTPDTTLGSHTAGSPAPAAAKSESNFIAADPAAANELYAPAEGTDTYSGGMPWAWQGSAEQLAFHGQAGQLPWLSPNTFSPASEYEGGPVAAWSLGPASGIGAPRPQSTERGTRECPNPVVVKNVHPALWTVLDGPDTLEREALLAVLDHDGYRP
ncbi:hypothetical protein AURDEDRAFT_169577 [Auricularia subglabra TFB-10046 SS5]|uniref:Uncharacterized protein n=1 Tax=Auricularia subglabra (strain TFB-10046 / SS5) TaxID=717982 RepID=J0DDE5_AURST|nr:hypothetical protein AURDEDRAFT_169577 [Auricularia subglabra TFB-10046 SS5]